ncbi:TBC1 domain family member 15-like isoform X3 [Syngnathus typhle]|uniref:TBC1 domain family member 15-like isoform X3 n=1 Tax=Syngnathus typhle TaxID=161592 RepID=UPI002A6A0448|nr:TBC1 domain family member 15-like isoform X3 [Syngnathus typhle]XP_061138287.1 TBC1 domain family member 15-like isoform X3 [Syngnathus typhle]
MAAESSAKVLFEQEGVFMHPCCDEEDKEEDFLVCGSLRIVEKDADVMLEFTPLEDSVDPSHILCAAKDSSSVMEWAQCGSRCPGEPGRRPVENQPSYEAEWDLINATSFKKKSCAAGSATGGHERGGRFFSVSLGQLAAVTLQEDPCGDVPSLLFTLKGYSSLPPLHFHQGGSRELLDSLRRVVALSECAEDESRLLISSPDKVLSQSFENLLEDNNFGLVQKFRKDPYVTTLGRFSKVTNYIFDAFRGTEEQHQRPPEEVAHLLGEIIPGLEINQQEEPGFEVVTRVDLGTRPQVSRSAPVSADAWNGHQDQDGRLMQVARLQESIFRGGLCHGVRKEAWKFLLGYFPWNSTLDERKSLQRSKTIGWPPVQAVPATRAGSDSGRLPRRCLETHVTAYAARCRRDEYFRMKLQWKSVSEEQERRNCRLRDYRSLIEKDVNRTDRSNRFFEGLDTPGLVLLHDVLMTYCMYDFDLGYVQGMSDLLSPIVFVMENEVDAFWCFVSFMEHMHQNFEEQMQGMKTQLIQLSTLLRLLDPSFCNYLESQDSGYLYFCFRWLLIRFKREFSFHDVLRLWEVMWTGLPCHNFHLLLCCAILDSEKSKIMEEKFGFNEILKHVNELSMKLDVEDILQKAESIWLQINQCQCVCVWPPVRPQGLPQAVLNILASDSEARGCRGSNQRAASSAAPMAGALHRDKRACATSSGHLRAMNSQNLSKVAFMS